jgi:hypothetical protein
MKKSSSFFSLVLVIIFSFVVLNLVLSQCQDKQLQWDNMPVYKSEQTDDSLQTKNISSTKVNAVTIKQISQTNGQCVCHYTIENYSDAQTDYSVQVSVQECKKSEVFRGFMYVGNFKQGLLSPNEIRSGQITIPNFKRAGRCTYRLQMQLIDTTNNGERFVDDTSQEF